MGSYYFRIEEENQGCNLLQAEGSVGLFFANSIDIQYFKGRLYSAFSVPLRGPSPSSGRLFYEVQPIFSLIFRCRMLKLIDSYIHFGWHPSTHVFQTTIFSFYIFLCFGTNVVLSYQLIFKFDVPKVREFKRIQCYQLTF